MSHPRVTVRRYAAPEKGKSPASPRAGSGWQRARQGAMRGFTPAVAAKLRISLTTLEHELDDISRSPVHRTAERIHAMRATGAGPDRLYLYVLEVLDAIRPTPGDEQRKLLVGAESCADADENVVGDRALLEGLAPIPRQEWADHLRRQAAASLALADHLDAFKEASL